MDDTPAVSTTIAAKTKSDLISGFTQSSDSNITKPATADYSNSFSGSGICNPAFNFEDDENDMDDEIHSQNGLAINGEPVVGNHSMSSDMIMEPSKGNNSKSQNFEEQVNDTRADPAGNDTDEDAASLSISTVSEASTVVPGESFKVVDQRPIVPEKKQSNAEKLVSPPSQPAIGRRVSVKSQFKLASGSEGNVRIVEIKSRDCVQGILRMQPKLGSSMNSKDHIAIVNVPVVSGSQKQQKQSRTSVNANNARQKASSICAGSGPSQESREGNDQKVRLNCFPVFFINDV